jgi:hypothetical protein
MNDPLYNHLRELAWRRKLTGAEEAELQKLLAAHPEAAAEWELERQLTELVGQTPEAPVVASNFTALVMRAVERETAGGARDRGWTRWRPFRGWLPKAATAGVVAGVGFFAFYQHQLNARELMARRVASLAAVVSTSDPEMIKNFDSICRLSDAPPAADTELIALMK